MRIDGKLLAHGINTDLKTRIQSTPFPSVKPTLSIILIGDNPASLSYIAQKQKAADEIGATASVIHLPVTTTSDELHSILAEENANPSIHGIIIQRPVPSECRIKPEVINSVLPKKDVDGFVSGSEYPVPVACAVYEILRDVYSHIAQTPTSSDSLDSWLRLQKITVVGRGETAGNPILRFLLQHGCSPGVIHSGTQDPDSIIMSSDIVISCVGKENIVRRDNCHTGTILVSVGVWKDARGKLHGDYEEENIADIASFYTPTPGGIGPVNVACLMRNLVKAATK